MALTVAECIEMNRPATQLKSERDPVKRKEILDGLFKVDTSASTYAESGSSPKSKSGHNVKNRNRNTGPSYPGRPATQLA